MSDYDGSGERVLEWEVGLPTTEDLAPLSQLLIPPELSSAFSIMPEPYRSTFDVNRASQNTMSSLRRNSQAFSSSNRFNFKLFNEGGGRDSLVVEGNGADLTLDGSDSRKLRRIDNGVGGEEADSALQTENCNEDSSARTLKRPRLVWTPQLHKRFVDAVAHLGIKNVVPKTIMQLMNVEGLTRENVASHLQKYRLYLKRMQGLSDEGPSSSDYLFASSPVPPSLRDSDRSGNGNGNGNGNVNAAVPIPIPYAPQMVPMSVYGGNTAAPGPYQGFESFPYSMALQRDWSANKFDFLTPNNK